MEEAADKDSPLKCGAIYHTGRDEYGCLDRCAIVITSIVARGGKHVALLSSQTRRITQSPITIVGAIELAAHGRPYQSRPVTTSSVRLNWMEAPPSKLPDTSRAPVGDIFAAHHYQGNANVKALQSILTAVFIAAIGLFGSSCSSDSPITPATNGNFVGVDSIGYYGKGRI